MVPQTVRLFYRTLSRNKVLSSINLLGLALGFASCILIAFFLFDELSYDSHHTNLKRIYRISTRFVSEGSIDHIAMAAAPLPQALTQNYPEVEACVRLDRKGNGVAVRNPTQAFREENAYSADAGIFNVFTFTFIHGDARTALSGPGKVVLTRTYALKYFGQTDATGSSLTIDGEDYVVTAVIEDVPENSDIWFPLVMSTGNDKSDDWFDYDYYVFVLFKEESLTAPGFLASFEKKLQAIADANINAAIRKENIKMSASMHLHPLKGLHFDNTLMYDGPKGNKNHVYIFACVAALILFIACINYINFSIVQSMEKSREVGIRKVVGSSFYQLVTRYIAQSFLLTCIALVIALGLVYLLLPFFNDVVDRNFSMSALLRPEIMIATMVILVVTGILAGSYPAFYGASVNIVSALKGYIASPGGKAIRKISITMQFAVSLGLIIATLVIYAQMKFIRNYDLGFRKDNVMAITTPQDSAHYHSVSRFKEELISRTDLVSNASIAGDGGMPGDPYDEQRGSLELINEKGEKEVRMVNYTFIDPDYFDVLGIVLKRGRPYGKESTGDQQNAIMVNEALVQALGWKDPLTHTIKWGGRERHVIGVVGNIHYKSLYNPVQPQVYVPHKHRIVKVLAALRPGAHARIDELQQLWQKHFPEEPFVYRYVDDTLHQQYDQEQTVARISTYFSILTIVISLLGVFGLSLLSAYQRKREIGIRRIIGARFSDIARLFFKEYLGLLTLAFIIISPVTWYIMQGWLTMFVSHTPLQAGMFIGLALAFALLTVTAILLSIQKVTRSKNTELIKAST